MSCLNDLEKSDINNLAAASVPLKLHQDNKSAHQTYKEIQGRAEARESSEHHGQRMMGGWVGVGGGGCHLHLSLCCAWVKVMRSTRPQLDRSITLAGPPMVGSSLPFSGRPSAPGTAGLRSCRLWQSYTQTVEEGVEISGFQPHIYFTMLRKP